MAAAGQGERHAARRKKAGENEKRCFFDETNLAI
jgi:hypothetical protein